MLDRPTAAELLSEARRTLLEQLLPQLPREHRYACLMVANAMAIAAREHDQLRPAREQAVMALSRLFSGTAPTTDLPTLERRLAAAIRAGAYDAAGEGRDALRAGLRTLTVARVRLSNPKALEASSAAD